jgi:plastocyanin
MIALVTFPSLILLITGCGAPPAPPTPEPGVTDVSMQGLAFIPKNVTINQGESVRWTNDESSSFIDHTVTSGNPGDADAGAIFNSGVLRPGESFTFTFDTPGTYVYFCQIHALVMRDATVTVLPSP